MPRGITLRKISLNAKTVKPKSSKTGKSEHSEQAAFFTWVRFRFPTLVIYAIPNDAKRSASVALRKKAEGLTAGIPDVNVDEARAGYFGLKLEFKKTVHKLKRDAVLGKQAPDIAKPSSDKTKFTDKTFNGTSDEEGMGGLSPEQKLLRARMRSRGYRVVTVYGFDHARLETEWYMSQPLTIGIADGLVANRPPPL